MIRRAWALQATAARAFDRRGAGLRILVALLLRISNAARAPLPARAAPPRAPIAEAGTELVERPK